MTQQLRHGVFATQIMVDGGHHKAVISHEISELFRRFLSYFGFSQSTTLLGKHFFCGANEGIRFLILTESLSDGRPKPAVEQVSVNVRRTKQL